MECTGSWFYYAPLKVDFCALENLLGVAGTCNALVRGLAMQWLKFSNALVLVIAMHWLKFRSTFSQSLGESMPLQC